MTLLPFTIEKWKEGLQPCTADGRPVSLSESITGTVDGHEYAWKTDGTPIYRESWELTLRLRPKTEKLTVVVCRNSDDRLDAFATRKPSGEYALEIARVEIEVPV